MVPSKGTVGTKATARKGWRSCAISGIPRVAITGRCQMVNFQSGPIGSGLGLVVAQGLCSTQSQESGKWKLQCPGPATAASLKMETVVPSNKPLIVIM